jgi:hypothetical protein
MVNVKLLVPPWQSRGASLGRLAVGRIEFGHPVNIGPRIRPVTSLGQVIAATATHTGSPSGGPARHQGDPARDARRAAIGPVILDDRFHETSPLQLVPLARKTLLFRRPDMIRILEAPD